MLTPDDAFSSQRPPHPPPGPFLADLYRHLPFLVVHLTMDGIILHCNPITTTITGYDESFLIGRNFWGTLFPGKLFVQIPRFISPVAPTPLLRDTPLTIRTRAGTERIIAFTRFIHAPNGDPADSGLRTMVCIGIDLTDRLLESDKSSAHLNAADSDNPGHGLMPFGPAVGNGGTVDSNSEGDFVTPLAISPPSPLPGLGGFAAAGEAGASAEAIRQVHEFLTHIDTRMAALTGAMAQGEMNSLASLAEVLHQGAHACGLLQFSARARALQQAAILAETEPVHALISEMLALYQPHSR